MKSIYIHANVITRIKQTICKYDAESGGVLASDSKGRIVDFYFDYGAGTGNISYVPCVSAINCVVNSHWYPLGLDFRGIIHSHPLNTPFSPSKKDILAAEAILDNCNIKKMLMIITQGDHIKAWELQQDHTLSLCSIIPFNTLNQHLPHLYT